MIAMTTSNSMSVKPRFVPLIFIAQSSWKPLGNFAVDFDGSGFLVEQSLGFALDELEASEIPGRDRPRAGFVLGNRQQRHLSGLGVAAGDTDGALASEGDDVQIAGGDVDDGHLIGELDARPTAQGEVRGRGNGHRSSD